MKSQTLGANEPKYSKLDTDAQSAPSVSVVLPVYRNADILHELYQRLCAVLETHSLTFELVFVNDACPTGSLGVLEQLARQDERVVVVPLDRNVGQHRAIMVGVRCARGAWVILMDADLQDPPEAIPALLKAGHGVAVVFAGRRGRYESLPRLLTSRLFKRLLHWLTGVPADAGLYVALRRVAVERLLAMDGPEPFVVAMIGCTRLPTISIPIERAARPSGESAYSTWGRIKSASRAIRWAIRWKCRGV